MNVHLHYRSGIQYCDSFSNFDTKVSRTATRIKFSFKQKDGDGRGYASLSLPRIKAKQFAYAILAAAGSDGIEPIQFSVEEPPKAVGS